MDKRATIFERSGKRLEMGGRKEDAEGEVGILKEFLIKYVNGMVFEIERAK
jgi:hypothetical protein